jgi:hypothetical protein
LLPGPQAAWNWFFIKKTLFIARGFMDVYLRISYGKS